MLSLKRVRTADTVATPKPRTPLAEEARTERYLRAKIRAECEVYEVRHAAEYPAIEIQPGQWIRHGDTLKSLIANRRIREHLMACRGAGEHGYTVPGATGSLATGRAATLLEAVERCIVFCEDKDSAKP